MLPSWLISVLDNKHLQMWPKNPLRNPVRLALASWIFIYLLLRISCKYDYYIYKDEMFRNTILKYLQKSSRGQLASFRLVSM